LRLSLWERPRAARVRVAYEHERFRSYGTLTPALSQGEMESVVYASPDIAAQAEGVDMAIFRVGGRDGNGDGAWRSKALAPGVEGFATVARDEDASAARREHSVILGKGGRDRQVGDTERWRSRQLGGAPDGPPLASVHLARVAEWSQHAPTKRHEHALVDAIRGRGLERHPSHSARWLDQPALPALA